MSQGMKYRPIVVSGFSLVVGALALAFGLAFGLGNTALAGEITRRWLARGRPKDGPDDRGG